MNYTEAMESKLGDLLEKTYDLEKLYEKAAEHADSPDLKAFFSQKSLERHGFARDLKAEMVVYRPESEETGSTGGKLHRGWMDVKAFFSANNDRAMLKEAINGERMALEDYREVLEMTNLPPSTEVLLTRQMGNISSTLSTIERMTEVA